MRPKQPKFGDQPTRGPAANLHQARKTSNFMQFYEISHHARTKSPREPRALAVREYIFCSQNLEFYADL